MSNSLTGITDISAPGALHKLPDPEFSSAFTLTFPSVEVALAELGQKVFGATIVIKAPPAPEPTPTLPSGLPPIPEGYVYIGEDTGDIVTGDISIGEQRRTILWFKNTFRSRGWHNPTGFVSGSSYGWHAAAPIGHPLAELNAAAWQQDKAAPAVEEAPLTSAEPALPDPGEGYRLLEEGEQILLGDEWLTPDGYWQKRAEVSPEERLNTCVARGGFHTPHRRRGPWRTPPTPTNLPSMPPAPDIEAHRRLTASVAQDHAITQAQLERDDAVADAHAQREEVKRLAAQCEAAAVEAGKQRDMVEKWRTRFEREQVCHAACGVIAMADTRKSAIEVREGMHPDYRSASVNDVARRVDECIALREEVKELKAKLAALETTRPEEAVNALPTPAPAYRLLDVGETLREDDEVNAGGDGIWRPMGGAIAPRIIQPKPSGPYPVGYYRRKLTPEEGATGYRLLAEGEAIGERDECRHPRSPNPENRDWRGLDESETWWVGKCNETPSTQFRRKILPA